MMLSTSNLPVTYYPNYYTDQEASRILKFLETLSYQKTKYKLFGKIVDSPREMLWIADDSTWTYIFSRNHIDGLPANQWPKELLEIKTKLEKFLGQTFNAVLINKYGPEDSISAHDDDDPWLGDSFIVPSLTFGTTRTFKLQEKKTKATTSLELKHGSLVVMQEECQKNYLHSIPKQKSRTGYRYNLTFRKIIPELICKQPKGISLPKNSNVEQLKKKIIIKSLHVNECKVED